MSRNEIRLRRTISPGQIARHRNYNKLMARHSRYIKMKRSIIALVYVLIIVLMILLYMLVRRAEHQKQLQKNGKNVALTLKHNFEVQGEPIDGYI
jgi:hypothetical protein